MSANERVAYLKGLFDGLEIDATTKEGKLLSGVLDVLQEFGNTISDLETQNVELTEQMDDVFMALVEGDDLDDDDLLDITVEDEDDDTEEDDEDEIDDEIYQIICPTCDEVIYLDDAALAEGSMLCPSCGEDLEFDFSELEEILADPTTETL